MNVAAKEYLEELKQQYEKQITIKMEILKNNNYVDWIEHFFNKMNLSCITDDDFFYGLYSKDDILPEDSINGENISIFVEICNEYAKSNYIKKGEDDCYYFQYNDNIYRVTIIHGPGSCSIIERIQKNNDNDMTLDIIDWEDIRTNKIQKTTILKIEKIQEIKNNIQQAMIEYGISGEYIMEAIETIINKPVED